MTLPLAARWLVAVREALPNVPIRPVLAVLLASILIGGILAVLSVQLTSVVARTTQLQNRLSQMTEERRLTRMVFAALLDADLGVRGFALTGGREFLKPYHDAIRRFPALQERLIENAAQTPFHPKVVRLGDLGRDLLGTLSTMVEAREKSATNLLLDDALDRRAKSQVDDIRTLVIGILEAESAEIKDAFVEVNAYVLRFERIALTFVVSSVLLLATAVVVALLYVAKRSKAERELARAKKAAEDATKAKSDFLANMNHEIRTPLTSIIGHIEQLADGPLTTAQRRRVDQIGIAGATLLAIVNDVLDFSQVEAGHLSIDAKPLVLQRPVDDAVTIVEGHAAKKGLRLRTVLDPALPGHVLGDEVRLRQILLNLLNNAVKFTHQGEIVLEVRSEERAGEREIVRFAISDTGVGIPLEEQAHLFERFARVDDQARRELGGTGLGLAITKRLVELMGGQIGFNSEAGRGSTFWIRLALPRAQAPDAGPHAALDPRPTIAGRLLLVEDVEIHRELARSVLEEAGHRVDTAVDGVEAVAALGAKTYDLVLMDIQMPRLGGLAAAQAIRAADHPAHHVPILAMTANVLPDHLKAIAEAGMNGHVGKPMKRADLLAKVDAWLRTADMPSTGKTAGGAPASAFDRRAFDELLAMVGSERAVGALWQLAVQLDALFSNTGPAASVDREKLAGSAHDVASQAALLGFLDLSRLCSELEAQCSDADDAGLPRSFDQARRAASAARQAIVALAARL